MSTKTSASRSATVVTGCRAPAGCRSHGSVTSTASSTSTRWSRSASSSACRSASACRIAAAGRADPLAGLGPRGGRQRADLGVGQRDRRAVAGVRQPGRLQLVQVGGGGDGGQRLAGHALAPLRAPARPPPPGHTSYSVRTSRSALLRSAKCHRSRRWPSADACHRRVSADAHGRRWSGDPAGALAQQPARPGSSCLRPAGQPKSGVPAGMVNRNSAPPPGACCTAMVPPCASTRPFTMNSPRPAPPRRLARQNWRKTRGAELGRDARPLVADRYRHARSTCHRPPAPPQW